MKAATGEVVTAEELGGADVHARKSGVADYYAENDRHALALCRSIISNLNTQQSAGITLASRAEPLYDAERARRHCAGRSQEAIRCPRSHCAARRRLRVRRVQGALWHDADHRLRSHPRHSGRHSRQQRYFVLGERAEGDAFHRAVLPAQDSAALSTEHRRLHGRPRLRGRRHRQGRRQDGDGRRLRAGAEDHGRHRRLLRRRQLRHVRPRLRPALSVHVAERAHLGDGRRAGG